MTTLKQALNNAAKLKDFISEHEKEIGDEEKVTSTIQAMLTTKQPLQKKKSVHRTSSQESGGNCNDKQTH